MKIEICTICLRDLSSVRWRVWIIVDLFIWSIEFYSALADHDDSVALMYDIFEDIFWLVWISNWKLRTWIWSTRSRILFSALRLVLIFNELFSRSIKFWFTLTISVENDVHVRYLLRSLFLTLWSNIIESYH